MSEERIVLLETHVTNLRIDNARLSEVIENLVKTMDNLAVVVTDLSSNMNKGKGAIWMLGAMSAAAGGLISWAMTHIFR